MGLVADSSDVNRKPDMMLPEVEMEEGRPNNAGSTTKHDVATTKTAEPLPEDTLQSMLRAKHVNVAFGTLRQIYLSRLDMGIHGTSPPGTADELQQLVDKLRPSITMISNPPGNNMIRTFGHLMNQYSASYYGYSE